MAKTKEPSWFPSLESLPRFGGGLGVGKEKKTIKLKD